MPIERTYPVPAKIQNPLLGATATMGDIDMFIQAGHGSSVERDWALRVRSKFVSGTLDRVCDGNRLPRGLVATAGDFDIVTGLAYYDKAWFGQGWGRDTPEFTDTIDLTSEEVAFTADAINLGAAGLVLAATMPMAMLDRTVATALIADAATQDATVVAVVDDLDRNAVLELLAIKPGPVVFRRHDGEWLRDDHWLRELKSVKPPPVVTVSSGQVDSVASQIDAATKGKPFQAAETASGSARLDEMRWAWMELRATPMVAAMPAKLQRYWLTGPGAAKIRWFTPGAWRRCYRQLVKYMNPYSARGACTNLSQKLGGHGVATHVGS